MQYNLFKIPFISGKPEKIISFDNNFFVSGICKIDKIGIALIFKNNHFIGLINEKNGVIIPWIGFPNKEGDKSGSGIYAQMSFPSSLCYSKNTNTGYVIESGGSKIKRIDLSVPYLSDIFGNVVVNKMTKYISKIKNIGNISTQCCVGKNEIIYWSVAQLHRCFKHENSDVVEFIGNGTSDYSVASEISNSSVNYPSGIVYNSDSIYISDTGNRCIRMIKDNKLFLVVGKPKEGGDIDGGLDKALLMNPSGLKVSRNILYFLDNGKIKYFSLGDKKVGTIYSSDKIIFMDVDNKNNLFVLEIES